MSYIPYTVIRVQPLCHASLQVSHYNSLFLMAFLSNVYHRTDVLWEEVLPYWQALWDWLITMCHLLSDSMIHILLLYLQANKNSVNLSYYTPFLITNWFLFLSLQAVGGLAQQRQEFWRLVCSLRTHTSPQWVSLLNSDVRQTFRAWDKGRHTHSHQTSSLRPKPVQAAAPDTVGWRIGFQRCGDGGLVLFAAPGLYDVCPSYTRRIFSLRELVQPRQSLPWDQTWE